MVSVAVPARLLRIVPPLPFKAPTVWFVPFRSTVPPFTVRDPLVEPKVPEPESCNVPALTVVPPLYVLAPLRTHVPAPAFVSAVVLEPLLSTIAPLIVLLPVFDPCSVRVLLPAPVAVRLLEKVTAPLPSFWMTAPPV